MEGAGAVVILVVTSSLNGPRSALKPVIGGFESDRFDGERKGEGSEGASITNGSTS